MVERRGAKKGSMTEEREELTGWGKKERNKTDAVCRCVVCGDRQDSLRADRESPFAGRPEGEAWADRLAGLPLQYLACFA